MGNRVGLVDVDPDGQPTWVGRRVRLGARRRAFGWTLLALGLMLDAVTAWMERHAYRLAPPWVWLLLSLAAPFALAVLVIGFAFAILWR